MAASTQQTDLPARFAAAVTPADGADLGYQSRGIYVGGGGNLNVDMAGNGATVLFTGLPSGAFLPISVQRVRSTSTTATGIVAVW